MAGVFTPDVLQPARKQLATQQSEAAARLAELCEKSYDIVIIGGGLSGASAAWHLAQAPHRPQRVLLVERGAIGAGSRERFSTGKVMPEPTEDTEDRGLGDEEEKRYHPGQSGGVLYSPPHFLSGPTCVKMIVQLYPTSTATFVSHHGEEGARQYLRLAALGIELQTRMCDQVLPNCRESGVLEQEGSVLLADHKDAYDLWEEYCLLKKLGCTDLEWWDRERIQKLHGKASGFVAGVHFPKDARIDALRYVEALMEANRASKQMELDVIDHCPEVVDIRDTASGVRTVFADGIEVNSKHAVVATNGLFLNTDLAGILMPCWSFFVALPHPVDPQRPAEHAAGGAGGSSCPSASSKIMKGMSSHNYFTYGFTHDWCVTKGVFRISGADHFSALKPPRAVRHCTDLSEWSLARYPHMRALLPRAQRDAPDPTSPTEPAAWLKGRYVYGVYGETVDGLPIIGKTNPKSNICYLVGCNAWGQASMSYAASLVPGLLGYDTLTDEQRTMARLLAISRFKTQPVYLRGKL